LKYANTRRSQDKNGLIRPHITHTKKFYTWFSRQQPKKNPKTQKILCNSGQNFRSCIQEKRRKQKGINRFSVWQFFNHLVLFHCVSVFIFVRLKSITTSNFQRFFIWQAIVRRPSVSTEGLFVSFARYLSAVAPSSSFPPKFWYFSREFSLHLQPISTPWAETAGAIAQLVRAQDS
jgi:hypothetical protein